MLPVPLDPVDEAELATAVAALHDRLSRSAIVYLECATSEWAPDDIGDPQGDVLDEQLFISALRLEEMSIVIEVKLVRTLPIYTYLERFGSAK